MPNYMTPGVYVEEVSTGARPIQAVGTSTAGFIGVAPDATAHVNESMAINNWSQFVREYASKSTPREPSNVVIASSRPMHPSCTRSSNGRFSPR